MKGIRTTLVLLLCAMCSLALVASTKAGGGYSAKTQPYEGQIKSVKIDKCGLQPGSCEGSVILAKAAGGEEITLAIRPGTWLKRGDQLVTIDELGIGNYVKVEAVQLPGQQLQQITILNSARE
jgi:hypothetical protein